MSGGALNYSFHRMDDAAHEIRERIVREPSTDEYGYTQEPQPLQVIAAFERAALLCEIAARAAHDVEWLLSGDTGDESFIQDSLAWTPERVAEMLAGHTSIEDLNAEERANRSVWRTINEWAKGRWNYQESRWNDSPDEATATRWACYDEVKEALAVHDENLDDIRPLRDQLKSLTDLAHRWVMSENPTEAECGTQITEALRAPHA